jgi:hypothetical protein
MTLIDKLKNIQSSYSNNKYIYNGVFILILNIIMTILYFVYNPYSFASEYKSISIFITLFNFFIILMSIFFILSRKQFFQDKGPTLFSFLYKLIILELAIFGVIVGIYSFGFLFSYFTNVTSTISLIIGISIIIGILAFIFLYFNLGAKFGNINDFSFLGLLKNIVFYIPCLFIQLIEYIKYQYSITTSTTWIILAIEILLVLAYIYIPILYKKIIKKKGIVLLSEPTPLYNEYNVSSKVYLDNNKNELADNRFNIDNPENDYKYSLSGWFYINPQPPSSGYQFNSYSNILNYGQKPIVLYKNSTNTLKIKILNNNALDTIYETNNVLLQKWNNLVISYDGGILDIFLNNELVKSVPGIVPYMNNDKILVGANQGIYGNLSSLVYFKKPLTKNQISNIYNSNKNKNPPTI